MPKMFDHDERVWINVPEEEVGERLYNGRFVLPKNHRVKMYNEDNEPVTVPSEEAYELLRQGFRYRSSKEEKEKSDQKLLETKTEYQRKELGPLGPVIAGGINFGREYTFGASDAGINLLDRYVYNTPGKGTKFYKELEDMYPTASMIGGIGGMITSGPGKIVAKGAAKAGDVAGRIVTKGAGALGLEKAGVLSRGAGFIARKGVEGAVDQTIYEGSKILSEAAGSDEDLNYEIAAQRLGSAMKAGAGFGVAIPATGHALRNAGKGIKAAAAKVAATKGGQAAKDIAAKVAAKAFGAGKGWGKDTHEVIEESLRNPKARSKLMAHIENPEQIAREATENIEKAFNVANKVSFGLRDVKKTLRAEGPIATKKITKAQIKGWQDVKNKITGTFKKMDEESIVYGTKPRKLAEQMINNADRKIAKATTAGEFFDAIDSAKGYIDRVGKKDEAAGFWDGAIKESSGMIEGYRNDINKFLRNEKIFDNHAVNYANVNDTLHNYMKSYKGVFGTPKKAGMFTKIIESPSGRSKNVVDEKKIRTYLRSPDRSHPEKWEALDNFFEASKRLVHNAKKPIKDLPPATSEKMLEVARQAEKDINKIKEYVGETLYSRHASLIAQASQSKTGTVLNQPQAMGIAGGYLMGPLGATTGYALGSVLSHPFTTIKVLRNIDDAAAATMKRVDKAVAAFNGKPIMKDGVLVQRTNYFQPARRALVNFSGAIEANVGKTTEETVRNIIERVNEYADDPQKIEEDFSRYAIPKTEDGKLDGYGASADNIAIRSMQFLASKAPDLSNDEYLGGEKVRIPHSQLTRFQKYTEAVADPAILIKQIETMSIDPVTVETVKHIYPKYFSMLRQKVLLGAAQNKNLSYQQKVQLGILFDAPITTAMKNVRAIQKNIIEVGKKQEQQQVSRRTSQSAINVGNESTMGQNLAGRG